MSTKTGIIAGAFQQDYLDALKQDGYLADYEHETHKAALRQGLPDILGRYSMDSEGEFIKPDGVNGELR